jgi:hypothetical protein
LGFQPLRPLSHDDAMDLTSALIANANVPLRTPYRRFDHRYRLSNYNAFYPGISLITAPKTGWISKINAVCRLRTILCRSGWPSLRTVHVAAI